MVLMWILIIVAVIVIAALSVYAGMLLTRLRSQNNAMRAAEGKRLHYLHESIETIAKAMQQDQCPLSEGCIRIAVLLDNLPEAERAGFPERFPAIHAMYERIKHMPTHDARKDYPKKEIRKLDLEREGYEVEMADSIQTDITAVLVWVRAERAAQAR
ncbi:DUF2489 domain-containing protein [Aliidiomarina halalkaliphila]|uniref:DUF2489 domain-containing protein n=1 Tax=Aliidiomarina halalkaliphila TaxID=2593535 RepID=A0A552X176_9GAMM|nr:DUF2489 domain-containing protein [Aliidiomarina halalkaliphila]TRW48787.1 DUF2489 domain-containing protein [Aliidiomarina halalkaliphila]